jgi:hypothetical protein
MGAAGCYPGPVEWYPFCAEGDVVEIGKDVNTAVPVVIRATEVAAIEDALVVAVELQLVPH